MYKIWIIKKQTYKKRNYKKITDPEIGIGRTTFSSWWLGEESETVIRNFAKINSLQSIRFLKLTANPGLVF